MGIGSDQVVAGEMISVQLKELADRFEPTFPVDIPRKFDDI